MNICLFTPQEITQPLDIRDERANHILKVLHKKTGDTFAAGIIGGMAGLATITGIETHEAHSADGHKTFAAGHIFFTFTPQTDGKPLYPLVMIVGFPRPIQLKRLLRDMAGLGVQAVHLTATDLGERSYLKSDLATTDAGTAMLLHGTEQAASTHVPRLYIHRSLRECLDVVAKMIGGNVTSAAELAINAPDFSQKFVKVVEPEPNVNFNTPSESCSKSIDFSVPASAVEAPLLMALDNVTPSQSLCDYLHSIDWNAATNGAVSSINANIPADIGSFGSIHVDASTHKCTAGSVSRTAVAAIGSERGWTNAERTLLESYGYKRLSMGKRVLRTETAATVAASLILASLGVLD